MENCLQGLLTLNSLQAARFILDGSFQQTDKVRFILKDISDHYAPHWFIWSQGRAESTHKNLDAAAILFFLHQERPP